MSMNKPFRPYVGRCFEFKNFTSTKQYPPVVLVMDENVKQVMFLDNEGNATWIGKHFLRSVPIESRVFSSPDTLTVAMSLIEKMRTMLVEGPLSTDKRKAMELSKSCARVVAELRDLGTRMQGVQFAPPMIEKDEQEGGSEPLASKLDKALAGESTDHSHEKQFKLLVDHLHEKYFKL